MMIAESRGANPITIKPYIPANEMVVDMTPFAYVVHLAASAITVSGAYDYGRAIIEMWSGHQLIGAARDLERWPAICRST